MSEVELVGFENREYYFRNVISPVRIIIYYTCRLSSVWDL